MDALLHDTNTKEYFFKHFSNPEEMMEQNEDERYDRERDMWERQFNLQQNQLENTTSLCNTLLRDQQTLISVLLNRAENTQSSAFASGTSLYVDSLPFCLVLLQSTNRCLYGNGKANTFLYRPNKRSNLYR